MAATPEAKVKAKIKKILEAEGVYYAMPIGSAFGNSGVPDFLCCVNGFFMAIEAKANGGKATALQKKHLQKINAEGGYALIVDEETLLYLTNMIRDLKEMKI